MSSKLEDIVAVGMDGGVDLKLNSSETLDLLDVLNFTYDTICFLIKEEKAKGSKQVSAKLDKYLTAADSLLAKVHDALEMNGVPPLNERH
jgi:hypothetical protein